MSFRIRSLIRIPLFVLAITLAGGLLRVYGLDHGAPYHFHADEMLALRGAELLRAAPHIAADSAKFFIYPVLPRVLALVASVYEAVAHPLDLGRRADATAFMLLGRWVSAVASTLTIPIVFLIGRRVSGATAGLVAAALLAGSVIAIANAHFFTADATLTFFCALTLLAMVHVAQDGHWRAYTFAGVSLGLAMASKYTAAFLLLPLATAHLASTSRPTLDAGLRAWTRWGAMGVLPLVFAMLVFVLVNPLIVQHWDRFLADVREGIVTPNFGRGGPVWTAQFADVGRRRYWFTNLLPWNLGPAFAIWALAGVVWLAARRERGAAVVAGYAVFYYLVASQTTTPYMRYLLPAVPALAVAAGALSAALIGRAPRQRRPALLLTIGVVGLTWLWGLAYMNVYRQPDARLQAARFIERTIAVGAHVLVEPSHNIPPMGSYLDDPGFFTEYQGWGARTVREDRFQLHTLDVYRHLYDGPISPDEKRRYIRDRLALVDYIVMDDTFDEFYEHLHGPEHAPVREYYRDLFAGRLDFAPIGRFKVNPSLFGVQIPDDRAEMTFALFDHPTIHVFARHRGAHKRSAEGQ